MYNKLFTKILDSSIWLAPDPTRLVWITLIAAMDEDGNAMFACVDNLAARARVTLEQAEAAVKAFESPDPKSGDPENEGRRIERFPGGWHILNAHKYRAMVTKTIIREQTRVRMARWRAKQSVTQSDAGVTRSDENVTPSEAISVSRSAAKKTTAASRPEVPPPEFSKFKLTYPARAGGQPWKRALSAIRARLAEGHSWAEITDGANRYMDYVVATDRLNTEYVMQAATFCGPEKHFLAPWTPPVSKGVPGKVSETISERFERIERELDEAGVPRL